MLFIVFVLSSTIIVSIINIIILAIYLVLIFSIIISNIDTKEQQEKQKQELKYINECSSNLQVVLSKVTDAELKYKIEQAYDIIRTSQVESNNLVYDIEIRIDNQIRQLRYELAKEQIDNAINIANEIIDLANERNIKLKISN